MTDSPQPTTTPASSEPLQGLSLGHPLGVPLRLSSSWFVGAAIITWVFAPVVERRLLLESPWTLAVAAFFAVLLGVSVLAHEMAHAVMAQRLGLRVRSMTIHLLGGVTVMDAETRRPWVDFVVAVVGPLTSLLVGGVAWLGYLAAAEGSVFAFIAWQLTVANLIVGVLNLVPALPLDGGRLLRDVVWAASGREYVGTIVAGWTGRAFAVVMAGLAVLPALRGNPDIVWLASGLMLAGFVWIEATRSLKSAGLSRAITSLRVSDLVRPAVFVSPETSLEAALQLLNGDRTTLVVRDASGGFSGVVRPEAAFAVPAERRPMVPVASVAVTHVGRVSSQATGQDLVDVLNAVPALVYLVEDEHRTVYGVLVTADVEATLTNR